MNLYKNKVNEYFSGIRMDLIKHIPENMHNKILEVGAGRGDTLVRIKTLNLADEVVGIDIYEFIESNQKNPIIDKFIFGNIETMQIDLPKYYFDVIILGDVLEHLLDPWQVILTLKEFLKNDGLLLISLPNIRDISTLYKVFIKGDFMYRTQGVLDKTHLRFFCKKNMVELIKESDLSLISIKPAFMSSSEKSKRKTFNYISFGFFEEFLSSQYIIVASKKAC